MTESETTRIEREHFLIHVPYEWKAVRGDDPLEFEFRNQTLPEQLIVTVMLAGKPLLEQTLRSAVERLVELRLAALAELSRGKAVCSPVGYQSDSGQVEARCTGVDEPNGVRIAWDIRSTKNKIVTVALTRYSLEEVGAAFEIYAGIIFDLVQVKD